ncbi:maltose ABC transporter permease MalF [uncultured Piscinibacter sp.]|uniref:maltose ABC transporter permease MalF n=1 Tax=uncultured Piscinibacter sp. TaxID=1131835 RepID=UPI002628BAC4|nr:maltose ABC transporter permease MalF [uncultured Piscinibacter sp.]
MPSTPTSPTPNRWLGPALFALVIVAALYLVVAVYATGEVLLAGTLLLISALAVWIYTAKSTYAFRYLFPGIAAAIIFVVFPMLYTITIGFSNYSSRNLLEFERAEGYFLSETFRAEGSSFEFSLHPAAGEFRGRLVDAESGKAFQFGPLALVADRRLEVAAEPEPENAAPLPEPVTLKELIGHQKALKALTVVLPDGRKVGMAGLREFATVQPLWVKQADGSLKNQESGTVIRPNRETGYFETEAGEKLQPGFHVAIGWDNYRRIFTEARFREPFVRIFVWTVVFSALTVLFATSLGMLLAVLLNWDALRFKGTYRMLLFLPYAVPGFISILVFKGLFNQNVGEINLILEGLFGIKPQWFSDPFLAKAMLLIVNTWLGFPYMMVICMGLIKAIPADLYEASAVAGAGPLTNFWSITLPLILKPLTPLLISSFAFNFNNFVLIALLTGGRPDFIDTSVPAGTTDLLVSYTYRIAFQDSGQNYGLAAAISTVIFLMVAAVSLVQMRFTRIVEEEKR